MSSSHTKLELFWTQLLGTSLVSNNHNVHAACFSLSCPLLTMAHQDVSLPLLVEIVQVCIRVKSRCVSTLVAIAVLLLGLSNSYISIGVTDNFNISIDIECWWLFLKVSLTSQITTSLPSVTSLLQCTALFTCVYGDYYFHHLQSAKLVSFHFYVA